MISVIVPAYNSEGTLEKCLQAVRKSTFQDYELVVVDDGSSDCTRVIALRYADEVVQFDENMGLPMSRKAGLNAAKGEIVVNIDSDVLIKPETLEKIANYLEANKDINALTGLLAKEHPNTDYFSQYKNLYMNYIFSKLPDKVSFIYGSIFAIRKKLVEHYQSAATVADDTEFGQQLAAKGEEIAFLRDLEVVHLKGLTFFSWVKNDFIIPFQWATIFLEKRGWMQLGKNKVGFGHAPKEQLLSVILVPSLVLLALTNTLVPLPGLVFSSLLVIWFIANFKFFLFLAGERGVVFGLVQAVPFTFLDHFVMASGIICGFTRSLFKRRRKTESCA